MLRERGDLPGVDPAGFDAPIHAFEREAADAVDGAAVLIAPAMFMPGAGGDPGKLGLSVRYGAWFDRQTAEDLDCPTVLRILARPGFLDEPMRVTWLAAKIRADPDSAGVKSPCNAITKLELMGLLRREPVVEGRKHRWQFSLGEAAPPS